MTDNTRNIHTLHRKLKVDVEDYIKWHNWKSRINRKPLEEIEWCLNGKPIEVRSEHLAAFKFTGLSNLDFASVVLGYPGIKIAEIISYQDKNPEGAPDEAA